MSVEGGKKALQNDLTQKKSNCHMSTWPALGAIKTLRYMQGGEGVVSPFLRKKYDEIAVNLHLVLFMLTFNLLQRLAKM